MDIAQATGQLMLLKNSIQRTRPMVMLSGPPRSSGIRNSPMEAERTRMHPVTIPDFERGMVIFQKVLIGEAPRSFAASRYETSSLSNDENIGKTINGR